MEAFEIHVECNEDKKYIYLSVAQCPSDALIEVMREFNVDHPGEWKIVHTYSIHLLIKDAPVAGELHKTLS